MSSKPENQFFHSNRLNYHPQTALAWHWLAVFDIKYQVLGHEARQRLHHGYGVKPAVAIQPLGYSVLFLSTPLLVWELD
jgi:hypothetical protein